MDLVDVQPVWSMSGSETLTTLDALHDETARRETYRLQLMARLEETGYAKELGAPDAVTLLSMRHRLSAAQVRADLKFAATLPKYELVAAALPTPFDPEDDSGGNSDETGVETAGDGIEQAPVWLHLGQAKAIVSALEQIPASAMVPVEDLIAAEKHMIEAGRELNPPDLRALGKKVRDLLDTDGPEPAEDAAYDQETLQLKKTDRGVSFSGRLANENAELLETLIFDNAKPHKTIDGQRDPRSKGKRQSDALTTVLNAAAGTGDTGHGSIKPHITVTIDYNDLKAALATNTGPLARPDANEGSDLSGESDAGAGLDGNGTSAGLAGFGRLSELGLLGGMAGFGDLVYGDRLSASAVRRLACDAGVLPIVLGSDSRPLDVGIEQRFVTEAMRLALNARDKGCVICGAPPRMCDAHHITHWVEGGPTSLDNLVLMCKHDHRDTHNGHWDVTITNGVVHVARPIWADPKPTRIRHRPRQADAADPIGLTDSSLPPTTNQARPPRPGRAWPYTGDIPWITADEAARLNPWGDEPDQPTTVRTPPRPPTDPTTWVSLWEGVNDTPSPGS